MSDDDDLFPELLTLKDVREYVWRSYAATVDSRRKVMLGVRYEGTLPLAVAEPGPLMCHAVALVGSDGLTLRQLAEIFDLLSKEQFARGITQLRVSGRVDEAKELRPDQAGRFQQQLVFRCS